MPVQRVENPRADEGMAASVRLGMRTLSADCSAVVIVLADMPNVTSAHVDRLIAAFDPAKKHEICRLTDTDGQPGHPVLFARRFFEHLGSLSGDIGARQIVAAHPEFVADVNSDDDAARVDLDTPEDWAEWRASQASEHP